MFQILIFIILKRFKMILLKPQVVVLSGLATIGVCPIEPVPMYATSAGIFEFCKKVVWFCKVLVHFGNFLYRISGPVCRSLPRAGVRPDLGVGAGC